MEHCSACGHDLREGARFCDACGAAAGTVVAPTEARKVVTVLFADLVGSTRLQEALDPESARRVIDRFASAMAATVTDHGGTVVKMMGDGLMAAWGVPTVAEDDAVRAVRAGLAMHERLETLNEHLEQEWGVRLRMRVGVNTGEVVVGADDDVIGDPVNVAARLESAAPPGRVLVGEQTRRLVRDVVGLESVPPLALRGKDLPVAAWLATTAVVGDRGGAETPFVARDAELARLRAAFDGAVAAREARLVTVIGSPGMGKSRLAAEFAAAIAGEARVVEGRCEHSGEGITYLPVAEVLRALADVTEAEEPAAVLAALQARVGTDDGDTQRIAQRAAGVLGLAEAGPPEETFWAVRRLLEAAARERPLVVVLDDVHWGEPQFLELVEHVATWTRGAPLLLVVLARPELRDVRGSLCVRGPLVLDVVELSALDAAASRALVAGVLGGDGELPPALAERVVGATGGNPLFLGETLRMLVGDGVLRREDDGAWVVDADEVDVPPTIHALLAARLERLAAGERQVVERASVIGKSFPRGGVEALLTGVQEAPLDDRLEALHRRELVEPEGTFFVDEPVFRFHHVLIRDAAYRALLKEARAELHERFADWLTGKAADRIGEHEEVVGYHLEQAHEYRRQLGPLDARADGLGARAAGCLGSSGRRALAREDLAAAANLLERALTRGGEEAELLGDLVEVHLSAGDATAAEAALERLDLAAGRDRRLRARVAVAGVELGRLTGEIGLLDAERELRAAAEALATAGDDASHAKALELLARSIAPLGRIAEAEAVLDRALAAARRAGDGRRVTAVLSTAPIVALYGPSPVPRASGRCLDVVRILRMGRGNRHVEARALRCQAVLEAMRGRADAARAILVGARSTFEELGLRLDLLELGVFDAMVELLLGEPEVAESGLRATASGLDGIGAGGALAHALLGRALEDQGRHEEAIAATRDAEALAGDDLQATALWVRVRAEALAGRGDLRDAEEHARRAVALADGTDALADHADCRLALARVLRAGGRDGEAAAEATRAAALYAAKGHEVGVGRALALGGTAPEAEGPAPPRGDRARLEGASTGGPRAEARERTPARVLRQSLANIAARDWDAHRRLFAAGFRGFDGRTTGQPVSLGRDAGVATVRSMFSPDTRIDVEVLVEDERVQLQRVRLAGSGPANVGAFEVEYLSLVLIADELMLRAEGFDVEDEAAARARASELMRTPTAELIYREFVALFRARDWDALEAMYHEEYAFADRRMLGWEPMGRATAMQVTRSVPVLHPDLDTDSEIVEADEHVVLVHSHWRGHAADGGGAVEYELFEVGAAREGLFLSSDWFSPEQEDEARARAAEVRATFADQASSDVAQLFLRVGRHSNERDWDAYEQLLLDGATTVDHATDGNPPTYGRAAVVDAARSIVAACGDARVETSLLEANDRTGLFRVRLSGHREEAGGAHEVDRLHVVRTDGERLARIEMFAADDLDGARARYEHMRSRTLPSLLMEQWMRFVLDRDWDALMAVRHEGFELIDHRPAGWGRIQGTEAIEVSRSMTTAFPADLDGYYEEIDGDDRVTLGRFGWHGHATDGGGLVDFEVLQVLEQHEGRMVRNEYFAPDDGASARARLAEVRGHTPRADPVEALAQRMTDAFNRRDWAALRALAHDDALVWDHRPLTGGRRTFDALVARQEEMAAIAPDVRLVVDEVLERGPDHGVWRWTAQGTSDGGDLEAPLVTAWVLRDGLLWRCGQWDAEQVEEARAWCAIARSSDDIDLDSPALATGVAVTAAMNRRNWGAARALYADDAVAVDHRPLGRGTLDADGWLESARRLADLGDWSFGFRTVWFLDDERGLSVTGYAGRSADGGSVDLEYLTVSQVLGGRIVRTETFDLDDAGGAWARLVELGADPFAVEVARVGIEMRATPGPRPPDAFIRLATQYTAANNVPDLARLRALLHDDFVARDHRSVPAPDLGPDGQVERVRVLHEVMPNARLVGREWLQVGPDHVLVRVAFETTHEDGAHTEWEWLARLAHRDGRFYAFDTFDVDDVDGARAWTMGGGQPESLRLARRDEHAHETRDWAADLEIFDPTFVLHDHRLVGTGKVEREAFLAQRHGLARMVPDISLRYVETMDSDDTALAGRVVVTGTSAEGAAFEWELAGAIEAAGGRLVRMMWCDAEHIERARAWCLCAQVAPGTPLDEVPSWRALRRWLETVHAGEAAVARPHPGARCTLLRVLERDDHMLLVHASWRWQQEGGPREQPFLAVMVAGGDTVEHLVTFEPEDEAAARAHFAALARAWRAVVTTLPAARPGASMFRATFAYLAGIAVRDWDLLASAYAPGAAFVDHRNLGFGVLSRKEHLGRLREMVELSRDVRYDVLETLVADEHGFIVRTRWSGTDEHGGTFEIVFLTVILVSEDGYERVETFDAGDEPAARARLAVLAGP